jgi:hypothetical protein
MLGFPIIAPVTAGVAAGPTLPWRSRLTFVTASAQDLRVDPLRIATLDTRAHSTAGVAQCYHVPSLSDRGPRHPPQLF